MRSVAAYKALKFGGRMKYPTPESLIVEPEVDASVQRTEAGGYLVGWRAAKPGARVYAGRAADQIDRSHPLAELYDANQVIISAEQVAARIGDCPRPYFEVVFADGRTLTVAERVLPLEGGVNFRDIGGYRTADGRHTRWGLVFRSGGLNTLTIEDLNYLHAIGLRLVCDLRTNAEANKYHDKLPDANVTYWHHPVFTDEESAGGVRAFLFNMTRLDAMVAESYRKHMIDHKARHFGEILRRFAEPSALPALFHCTAGKDRTGVTAMLLLGVLGVPDETIIADYSLSNRYFSSFQDALSENMERLRRIRLTLDDLRPMLMANPAAMREAIAHIRTAYGSFEAYLTGPAGLEASTITKLRDLLLE
jgi:protein-tyrosine phosphatase